MNCDKVSAIAQFFKFGLVGISNTLVNYIVYAICITIGMHYIMANIIAYILSVLNSFYWNNKYVFKKDDWAERNWKYVLLKTFAAYAFTGLVLQNVLMYILLDVIHISDFMSGMSDIVHKWGIIMSQDKLASYIAPLFVLVITIPLNFIINKLWAFRDQKRA